MELSKQKLLKFLLAPLQLVGCHAKDKENQNKRERASSEQMTTGQLAKLVTKGITDPPHSLTTIIIASEDGEDEEDVKNKYEKDPKTLFYLEGTGVGQDLNKAAEWFQKAAVLMMKMLLKI